MGNRHVPFICGIVAIGIAAWLVFDFEGWWRYLIGAFLLAFGCASIKTSVWATDAEITELTKPGPVSRETKERFQERLSLLAGSRREQMDYMEDGGIDAAGQFAACAAMYYELADADRAMGKAPSETETAEERGNGARRVARGLLYRATGDWGAAEAHTDEYIGKAREVWRSQLRKEGGISPSCRSDMSKCFRLSDLQDKLLAEMRADPPD